MRYELLLADADGTLYDFHAGERAALEETLLASGIPYDGEIGALYSRINLSHWKKLERGETTQERLRVERFADFLAELAQRGQPTGERSAPEMSQTFVSALSRQRVPMPGAEAFLQAVAEHMPVYLVTNGIASVQRGRFEQSELRPYITDILISEELGHFKPDPFMLLEAMRRAGVTDRRRVVMLGDSLTADIAAAQAAGVDSILITHGAQSPQGCYATHVALSLADAARVVLADA